MRLTRTTWTVWGGLIAGSLALNIVLGQLVRNVVGLPIFLDSVGTIVAGALAGPLVGAAVGATSNIVWGLLFRDPGIVPFGITAACIGLAAAAAATLGAFRTLPGALLAGLITGIMAAVVSAPIAAYIQQAQSGPGQIALRSLVASTSDNLLQAVTLQGFVSDPLDKAISFGAAFFILKALPREILDVFAAARSLSRSRRVTARYGVAAGLSTLALLFAWVFLPAFGPNVYAVFYLAVITSAWYGGLGPGLLSAAVGLLANVFLSAPPFGPGLGIEDWLRIAIYLTVSLLIALITDRLERTNAALSVALTEQRSQEAQRMAVINSVVEALALVAPDDHRLLAVNHQFEDLFGVDAAEVLGRRLDELNSPMERAFEQPEQFRERLASTAADSASRFTDIIQQVWPQERILELVSTPVLTDDRFVGRLYSFRDVTQERELDRMKTEFVSQVSHELRTPLTAIKGFTELLLDGDAGDINAEQQEYLEIVKTNVDRLVALINDLLDISRIESGRIKLNVGPIDLNAIVESVVATMRPLLESKSQILTTQLDPELPLALGDHDRIVQVVTNLVSNAHKYTPNEGAVRITTQRSDAMLRVAVADNGMGIPAEDVPKLFTRFFRVDSSLTREIGGTGLGLSIVKSIVELQGGTVSVDTELGQGSTFAFTLPVVSTPERAPVVHTTPGTAQHTVLVVDQDPDIAEQLESTLTRAGYTVEVARDTSTAVTLLADTRPDLVMLRVRLTSPAGFDEARVLAQAVDARDIPLLVVSVQPEAGAAAGNWPDSHRVNEMQIVSHVQQALTASPVRRVLIIEDDAATRQLLAVGLRNHGLEPLEAADGESGLVAATEQAPDLILLDLRLPGTDGFSVLQQLKHAPQTGNIPVIVVTGDDELWLGARARVLAMGATDFVAKPFELNALVDEIRTLIPQKELSHVDTRAGR